MELVPLPYHTQIQRRRARFQRSLIALVGYGVLIQ